MGECDHFLPECGWVWVFETFICLGMGECDLFFGWVWANLGGYDLFLVGCGWVQVGVYE